MLSCEDIRAWIKEGLPEAEVVVSGDGHHFEATVVCPAFKGKNMLEQHRMVYQTLGTKMGREIHALSLQTRAA